MNQQSMENLTERILKDREAGVLSVSGISEGQTAWLAAEIVGASAQTAEEPPVADPGDFSWLSGFRAALAGGMPGGDGSENRMTGKSGSTGQGQTARSGISGDPVNVPDPGTIPASSVSEPVEGSDAIRSSAKSPDGVPETGTPAFAAPGFGMPDSGEGDRRIESRSSGKPERRLLILTASYERAQKMEDYLAVFAPDVPVHVFPDEERRLFSYEARSRILGHRRIRSLTALLSDPPEASEPLQTSGASGRQEDRATFHDSPPSGEGTQMEARNRSGGSDSGKEPEYTGSPEIFIAPVMAAAKGMCSPDTFRRMQLRFAVGESIERDEVVRRLTEMGYERTDMTEVTGQFSLRGDILDVFPPDTDDPCRIDFFDTEVDSIKAFDPMTQRSTRNLQHLTVSPSVTPLPEQEDAISFLWDYVGEEWLILADDWDRICEQRDLADRDWAAGALAKSDGPGPSSAPQMEPFAEIHEMAEALCARRSVITTPFKKKPAHIVRLKDHISVSSLPAPQFGGRMDLYGEEIRHLHREGYTIQIAGSTEERIQNLRDYAARAELDVPVNYVEGALPAGMYFPEDRLAILSDSDIYRSVKKKRKTKKKKNGRPIQSFTELKKGDYVVHENHGIGRFVGIEPLVVEGIRRDYMKIGYAGKDVLYIPVEQMDLVQSYIGSGGDAPKVSRLGSGEWKKTKERAKAAIAHMAEDLVRMAAERKMEEGFAFDGDTPWQKQFEEEFPYQETEDQLRSVEEIKMDMQMPWPMDRLLCGDVGFGKTEVAARAVFKCVMDSKQAAVLVPTTILAEQHYKTFCQRFENFPVRIDLLSRFRSPQQQARTIEAVKKGEVDVLIGTHRMLSKDVAFRDLGLLVVDEEQRFGVQHKERIKRLKKNVDVLTLSATPIPRTLHMSLSGIRSMSTLEEPPQERYPVQTYVMEQDDPLIREILLRELDRGGQAFVVFNRVEGILQIAEGLKKLVPEARIAVGHGQMSENALEDVMNGFVNYDYDILVATTIVENGIDVPNANTLIVLDADRYGLSQLYQLKGRVGRSDRAAYAYFMYNRGKVLSEAAVKRLQAIRRFTEFGSGFRIAMKDLEIRGAGNLLGTEQSGHMMMIGYELYCKLIDEAVRALQGQKVEESELETAIDIKVDAFISSDYIDDEAQKLDMYQRIAGIRSREDMQDVMDELIDRFGDIPPETLSLMQVARMQALCRAFGISRVGRETGNRIIFEFEPGSQSLTPRGVDGLAQVYGQTLVIHLGAKPFIRMPLKKPGRLLEEILAFLETLERAVSQDGEQAGKAVV